MYLINADTGSADRQRVGIDVPDDRERHRLRIRRASTSATSATAGRTRCRPTRPRPATAAASSSTRPISGDIDGKYWRFNFTPAGTIRDPRWSTPAQPIYASSALLFVGSADVYMFFATGSDLLPATAPGRHGHVQAVWPEGQRSVSGAPTKFTQDLATVTNVGAVWPPASGRRPPRRSPATSCSTRRRRRRRRTPCADFTAKLYAVTYTGGAAYDSNGNGKLDNNESPIAATMAGRATAPFIVDQHLYFGYDRRGRRRPSRRSAIPRTSTTASARSACASCRGGRSASEQVIARRDCVRILRRQAAGRATICPRCRSAVVVAREVQKTPSHVSQRTALVAAAVLGIATIATASVWLGGGGSDPHVTTPSASRPDPLARPAPARSGTHRTAQGS